MKRKFAFGFLFAVLTTIALLSYKIYHDVISQQALRAQIRQLPDFEFTTLEGRRFARDDLPSGREVVVGYLHTLCPFCQAEIKDITRNASLLQDVYFVFVFGQDSEPLKRFATEYGLEAHPNIAVLSDRAKTFKNIFGTNQVPSLFVYDTNHRLLRHFRGETSAQVIYETIAVGQQL